MPWLVPRARALRRADGQSVVETALAVPVLLVVLIGAFEGARLLLAALVMQSAVQEGAQYGALSPANAANAAGIAAAVRAEANLPGAGPANPAVASATATDANGERVVTVTATFTATTLFAYPGLAPSYAITRSATTQVRR